MKDYELYNDYHRWIKQGDKVDKYAYEKLQEYKSLEDKIIDKIIEQKYDNKYKKVEVLRK